MAIQSTNMLLPIPVVGVDDGPQWATYINSCLNIIDSHDHSPGSGVQVTPAGMNISSDLSFQSNNAIALRSSRYTSQPTALSGASDLGCTYVVADDLYYNDGQGNQVQITANGAVAGTPGSIANLTSPASASYVSASASFVFQSNTNVAANLDCRNVILRKSTASSAGLTLSPPNSLSIGYTITLPSLPASTKILSIDSSGNMAAVYGVDGSTITITSNVIGVPAQGITVTQIADDTITAAKMAAGSINTAKIVDSAITTIKINDLAVTTDKIDTAAVTTDKIDDLQVTAGKMANATITTTQISSSAGILGSQLSASAAIAGTQLASGAAILGSQLSSTVNLPVGAKISGNGIVGMSGSSSGFSIIRGTINADGTKFAGEGFTPSRVGDGSYTITFSVAFAGAPSVVITGVTDVAIPTITSVDTTKFIVFMPNTSGVDGNHPFSFIVIGPR